MSTRRIKKLNRFIFRNSRYYPVIRYTRLIRGACRRYALGGEYSPIASQIAIPMIPHVWKLVVYRAVTMPLRKVSNFTILYKQPLSVDDARFALPVFWAEQPLTSFQHLVETLGAPFYPQILNPNTMSIGSRWSRRRLRRLRRRFRNFFKVRCLNLTPFRSFRRGYRPLLHRTIRLPSVKRRLIDVFPLSPFFGNVKAPFIQATLPHLGLHQINMQWLVSRRDTVVDFPKMSALFRAAKAHFMRFVSKSRRNAASNRLGLTMRFLTRLKKSREGLKGGPTLWSPATWNIRRIRLKPGISRIWRVARRDLKILLDFPVRYQHRLTWRLTKMARVRESFVNLELTHRVQYLLMRLRLVTDLVTSLKMIQRGTVFLNGYRCFHERTLVVGGDCLSLVLSWEYYLKIIKISFVKKPINSNWYRLVNFRSFRSCYRTGKLWRAASATNKFKHLAFIWDETPPFYQFDWFTLSCFILRETSPHPSSPLHALFHTPIFILNVYNWKYIT